jgi:hypothetical protein
MLSNTHTHAGPDLNQKDFPSTQKPWLDTVEDRTLAAIREAMANRFPASVAAAEGEIRLGYNRIQLGRDGVGITWFENPERIPFGPVDPMVGVIRIANARGKTRAVLVNYACHPVVLGPKNTEISADYPGPMAEKVEKALGDGAMCLFLQGAAGDINPLFLARGEDSKANFAMVRTMGELLGDEVLETLEEMGRDSGMSERLQATSETTLVSHRWDPEKKLTLGITSVLINSEIGIVAMPGEPFHAFQKDLRRRAELPHAYLFGYTDNNYQDWPDYLPDIQSAAHAGYGASTATSAGAGAGERLLDLSLVQLYTMRGMFRDKPWQPPSR